MSFLALHGSNNIGEYLRAIAFAEHDGESEVGGYTTFAVRADARPLTDSEFQELHFPGVDEKLLDQDDLDDLAEVKKIAHTGVFDHQGLTIKMLSYYDGDGVITFAVYQDDKLVVMFSNNDCKKNYRWQRHQENTALLARALQAASDCWVVLDGTDCLGVYTSKKRANRVTSKAGASARVVASQLDT